MSGNSHASARGFGILLLALALMPIGIGVAAPNSDNALPLQEAIDRAVAFSPKLQSAQAGIGAARGVERQAGALPNPTASIGFENFGGTGRFGGLRETETTLSASELIELGGKRQARQGAALANRRASELETNAVRLDLIRDVTVAYNESVAAEEALKLATELEETARTALRDVTRRVNAARDPRYQRSRAQVALTNAIIARQRAAEAAAAARHKLAQFWGADALSRAVVPDALFKVVPPPDFASLEARLRNTPDIKRMEVLREARAAELRLAEAGTVPDLTVSAGVRRLQGSHDTAFIAGISIPIPIFNQNEGEIMRAGAEVTRALRDKQQAELNLARDLIDAWTQWKSSWFEADNLKTKSLPDAERAYTQVLSGYRAGAFQYLDVLDTQRTLFETRSAYITALLRLQTAKAQVERLIAASNLPSETLP